MSVTDVCFDVGYSSLGTFTRRFSEVCGLPPSQFRAEARHKGTPSVGPVARADAVSGEEIVDGRVVAPADFKGLIFVGAFETPIPQGHPISYVILDSSGSFRLQKLDDGDYFILAAGLRSSDRSDAWFLYEDALRASSGKVTVSEGCATRAPTLSLRKAIPTDPPILLSFPSLLPSQTRSDGDEPESSRSRDRPELSNLG